MTDSNNRTRTALLVIILAMVTTTAGLFLAARLVVSPTQQAARSALPDVEPAKASVEMRSLAPKFAVRARIIPNDEIAIALPPSDLPVTRQVLHVGDQVKSGTVVSEIGGNPVVLLSSGFSGYRDLKVGDAGPDVDVIHRSLRNGRKTGPLTAKDMQLFSKLLGNRYVLPTQEIPPQSEGDVVTLEPYIPATWWVGVEELPRTVTSAGPPVGAKVGGEETVLKVAGSGSSLLAEITPGKTELPLAPGQALQFNPGNGKPHVVYTIKSTAIDEDTAKQRIEVEETIDPELLNTGGRLSTSSDAAPVLAVPALAVFDDNGKPSIKLADSGQLIHVSIGSALAGWIEVSSNDSRLVEGLKVELRGNGGG